MASFAKLRAARQAKEKQKSFIRPAENQQIYDRDASQKSTSNQGVEVTETSEATVPIQVQENFYSVWSLSEFEIRTWMKDLARGRGVFSQRQYRPGDRLVFVKPNVSVLSIANLPKYCSTCASPVQSDGTGLKRCSGCKVVHYCSDECQNRDWSMHKPECAAIQSWARTAPSTEVAVPSDAVRCLGRILWRKKKSGGESYFAKEFDAMQSHRTSLQPSTYELHTHLAHALVRYLNLTSPQEMQTYGLVTIADLVDVISRFTTNTVALTTPSLTPIGACISPSIALLNHSCDPNAVIVFPRSSANPRLHELLLQVIAIKPIGPGEEVLTAYIDTTLPHEDRQKTLKEAYSFDCRCTLCFPAPGGVDLRKALLCLMRKDRSKCMCSGLCEIPTEGVSRCNVCNATIGPEVMEEIRDAIRVSQEGLVKARDLQYKDPARAIHFASNLTGILTSAGLAPGAHPLLALSRLHSSMLIENLSALSAMMGPAPSSQHDPLLIAADISTQRPIHALQQSYPPSHDQTQVPPQSDAEKKYAEEAQEKLDDAIRAAVRVSTGLSTVLVPGHPLRGLALAELGKLLSVDEPVPKYLASNSGKDQKGVYPPSGPARLRLARDALIRARMELMVGFGGVNEGGQVGMEVREWLVMAEKELQVWKAGMQNGSE